MISAKEAKEKAIKAGARYEKMALANIGTALDIAADKGQRSVTFAFQPPDASITAFLGQSVPIVGWITPTIILELQTRGFSVDHDLQRNSLCVKW